MNLKQRINAAREFINIRIYDSRDFVMSSLATGSLFVATFTLMVLVFYHGYELDPWRNQLAAYIVRGSIAFYLLKFFLELFYNFHPREFLKDRKWEGMLMLFIIVDILVINIFKFEILNELGQFLKIPGLQESFMLFLQLYFLVIVGLEFGKVGELLPKSKLSPPTLLILSFVLLILMGTGLLMLPEMTIKGHSGLDLLTALFTSISASCVTGLSLIDISEILSGKSQIVVMILMQLGGLNIISFAALFAILRGGFGMRQANFMSENLGEDLKRSRSLIGAIFKLTIFIELVELVVEISLEDVLMTLRKIFLPTAHMHLYTSTTRLSLFSNSLASEGYKPPV